MYNKAELIPGERDFLKQALIQHMYISYCQVTQANSQL